MNKINFAQAKNYYMNEINFTSHGQTSMWLNSVTAQAQQNFPFQLRDDERDNVKKI